MITRAMPRAIIYQDLVVAQHVFRDSPDRHIDIGSRIDGFVAHVAAFRKIEVIDVRPMDNTDHANIKFTQGDIFETTMKEATDSLSCLHALEHFGLGRYGDPITIDGHLRGIAAMIEMVRLNGRVYFSFPIGRSDQVVFNAHRIFHPASILSNSSVVEYLELEDFSYVDDQGDLHRNADPRSDLELDYGCGIYVFRKTKASGGRR